MDYTTKAPPYEVYDQAYDEGAEERSDDREVGV
jgi:hypothetical protein